MFLLLLGTALTTLNRVIPIALRFGLTAVILLCSLLSVPTNPVVEPGPEGRAQLLIVIACVYAAVTYAAALTCNYDIERDKRDARVLIDGVHALVAEKKRINTPRFADDIRAVGNAWDGGTVLGFLFLLLSCFNVVSICFLFAAHCPGLALVLTTLLLFVLADYIAACALVVPTERLPGLRWRAGYLLYPPYDDNGTYKIDFVNDPCVSAQSVVDADNAVQTDIVEMLADVEKAGCGPYAPQLDAILARHADIPPVQCVDAAHKHLGNAPRVSSDRMILSRALRQQTYGALLERRRAKLLDAIHNADNANAAKLVAAHYELIHNLPLSSK